MPRQRVELSLSTREFLDLVRAGRLGDVENWIKKGNSLHISDLRAGASVLCASVKAGFYSLVELVLRSEKWEAADLASALRVAMSIRRIDLVDLLLGAGAPIHAVYFDEVCQTMNVQLIERFLVAGLDPAKGNGFAQALNEHKAKPLLGIYRGLRGKFPALDPQASLALSEAIRERNLRWTALLAWAGADPFAAVPHGINVEWPDDLDFTTTPAIEACMADNVAFIRALKLRPTSEQLRELLSYACFRPHKEILTYLLKLVPNAEINEPETNSSKALENLVKESKNDRLWSWPGIQDREKQILESAELLLDHGARWNPSDGDLSYARRGLRTHDPKHVVQLVRLLLYTNGAAEPSRVWELCRTPKIRDLIRQADAPLWHELLELAPD
jgi:hypothetical protein